MKKRPFLFLLRAFNDTDHMAPIIWKLSMLGHPVRVILVDKNLNIEINEGVLKYLQKKGCPVHYYYALPEYGFCLPNRLFIRSGNPFFMKIFRFLNRCLERWVWTLSWAEQILERMDPAVCVVDSHGPDVRSLEGKLILAAKKRGVSVLCLPHGTNVYLAFDKNAPGIKKPVREVYLKFPTYSVYDKIVLHSRWEVAVFKEQNPELTEVISLGMARFSNEWSEVNASIRPAYAPKKDTNERLKVLFLLPHWKFVDKEGILEAVERIASMKSVFLAIKEHTREGAGSLPRELRVKYLASENADVIQSARATSSWDWIRSGFRAAQKEEMVDSTPLVLWADLVVCFCSSVGIEAVCRNKPFVNPLYLFTYATVFESLGVGIEANSHKDLVQIIEEFCNKQVFIPYSVDQFHKEVICNGEPEKDILRAYSDLIISMAYESKGAGSR